MAAERGPESEWTLVENIALTAVIMSQQKYSTALQPPDKEEGNFPELKLRKYLISSIWLGKGGILPLKNISVAKSPLKSSINKLSIVGWS